MNEKMTLLIGCAVSVLLAVSCYKSNSPMTLSDFTPLPGTECERAVIVNDKPRCHTFYGTAAVGPFGWQTFIQAFLKDTYANAPFSLRAIDQCICPHRVVAFCAPVSDKGFEGRIYSVTWFAGDGDFERECQKYGAFWGRPYVLRHSL